MLEGAAQRKTPSSQAGVCGRQFQTSPACLARGSLEQYARLHATPQGEAPFLPWGDAVRPDTTSIDADGIVRMLDEGRDREDVITQLATASKALDRAGFGLVVGGLRECLTTGEDSHLDTAKLERLFVARLIRSPDPVASGTFIQRTLEGRTEPVASRLIDFRQFVGDRDQAARLERHRVTSADPPPPGQRAFASRGTDRAATVVANAAPRLHARP